MGDRVHLRRAADVGADLPLPPGGHQDEQPVPPRPAGPHLQRHGLPAGEGLGGHPQDARTPHPLQGLQAQQVRPAAVNKATGSSMNEGYFFFFFFGNSYQTCSLMKYMDRYKIKPDTKAFHLVSLNYVKLGNHVQQRCPLGPTRQLQTEQEKHAIKLSKTRSNKVKLGNKLGKTNIN